MQSSKWVVIFAASLCWLPMLNSWSTGALNSFLHGYYLSCCLYCRMFCLSAFLFLFGSVLYMELTFFLFLYGKRLLSTPYFCLLRSLWALLCNTDYFPTFGVSSRLVKSAFCPLIQILIKKLQNFGFSMSLWEMPLVINCQLNFHPLIIIFQAQWSSWFSTQPSI